MGLCDAWRVLSGNMRPADSRTCVSTISSSTCFTDLMIGQSLCSYHRRFAQASLRPSSSIRSAATSTAAIYYTATSGMTARLDRPRFRRPRPESPKKISYISRAPLGAAPTLPFQVSCLILHSLCAHLLLNHRMPLFTAHWTILCD